MLLNRVPDAKTQRNSDCCAVCCGVILGLKVMTPRWKTCFMTMCSTVTVKLLPRPISACKNLSRRLLTRHPVCYLLASLLLIGSARPLSAQQPSAQPNDADSYRQVALAEAGDVEQGRTVFNNPRGAGCAKCHSLDGSRTGVGPDLAGVGGKFDRVGLIQALLEPSAAIAVGYGTTNILLENGKTVSGVVQRVTDEWLELKNPDGRLQQIPLDEIQAQQESSVSIMPTGLHRTMTPSEFTDLVTFLQTRQQITAAAQHPGDVREIPRAARGVTFLSRFPQLERWDRPVAMEPIPGQAGGYFLLEQAGRVHWVTTHDTSPQSSMVLDLRSKVRAGGATGLLGIACHPKFSEDPRVFLKYQRQRENQLETIIEEWRWRQSTVGTGDLVDPREILVIPAVTQDHNGGSLAFGPDGYLYAGMGDSGPQRDPAGHGQDLRTLLGKLIRIDIDRTESGRPYAIPEDNPFREQPEARPEIFALGFREPWRISFDPETAAVWVGDVGQDRFEEITLVRRGENHGWNVHEGFSDFSNQYRQPSAKYVRPVLSYPRSLGVSVTGGYVYRGTAAPQLRGWYVFADFESRRIWALQHQDGQLQRVVELGRAPSRVVSFMEDTDHELCMIGYDDGRVHRLVFDAVNLDPLVAVALAPTAEQVPILWRYALQAPAGDWTASNFDDTTWRQAPAGFGTVGTPGGEIRTTWRTNDIWLRREFTLAELPPTNSELILRIHHDEDTEVFLNGVELIRLQRWTTGYTDIVLPATAVRQLRLGTNTLALHCHQNSGGQYIDCGLLRYVQRPAATP